jgi:archaellin
MNVIVKRAYYIVLLATIVVAAIAGCAEVRKLTYRDDFVYLDKKEVESLMQNMSEAIGRLELLVSEASESDVEQQKKIVSELGKIERIAIRLSGGYKKTNQFFISEHMGDFISDVGSAKMMAGLSPPKYSKAKEISNSCQACHQHR